MWCIPQVTPQFEERMLDVLTHYEKGYDPKHPVVCVDEKNHQLLSSPKGEQNTHEGSGKRIDYLYKRHGVVNEFVAFEGKVGKRYIRTTDTRKGKDFAKFIRFLVMDVYKDAEKVIFVLDNLNTHKDKSIIDTYGEGEGKKILTRLEWHYTPKHASWLNMAEFEIGNVTKAVLKRRLSTKKDVKRHVRAYQVRKNKEAKPVKWKFTTERAKEKFKLLKN